jgi:hypothetical protein
MTIHVGKSLLLPKSEGHTPHLWVVVTPPIHGEVVILNITSLKSHSDHTVIIDIGDHPFIRHPSIVYYADATLTQATNLQQAIDSGMFQTHKDFSSDALARIQAGIFISDFTPIKIRKYCEHVLKTS